MPAEPRRTVRKISTDDEIELKRARGEISCAECRRYVLYLLLFGLFGFACIRLSPASVAGVSVKIE